MKCEFRIGNIVYAPKVDNGKIINWIVGEVVTLDYRSQGNVTVKCLTDTDKFEYITCPTTQLVGVGLTQAMIFRFGFKRAMAPGMFQLVDRDVRYKMTLDWSDMTCYVHKGSHIAVDFQYIDFVHDLQNIIDFVGMENRITLTGVFGIKKNLIKLV